MPLDIITWPRKEALTSSNCYATPDGYRRLYLPCADGVTRPAPCPDTREDLTPVATVITAKGSYLLHLCRWCLGKREIVVDYDKSRIEAHTRDCTQQWPINRHLAERDHGREFGRQYLLLPDSNGQLAQYFCSKPGNRSDVLLATTYGGGNTLYICTKCIKDPDYRRLFVHHSFQAVQAHNDKIHRVNTVPIRFPVRPPQFLINR